MRVVLVARGADSSRRARAASVASACLSSTATASLSELSVSITNRRRFSVEGGEHGGESGGGESGGEPGGQLKHSACT